MESRYGWKDGARTRGIELDAVVPILQRIEEEQGAITPEDVVVHASPPSSPLHGYFTWDDTEAAQLHRLNEARTLIRSVTVTYVESDAPPRTVRAFVHYGLPGVYESSARVMADNTKREMLLAEALAELKAFRRRYADLKALAGVFAALDSLGGPQRKGAA